MWNKKKQQLKYDARRTDLGRMRTAFNRKSFWNVKALMTNFLVSCFWHKSIDRTIGELKIFIILKCNAVSCDDISLAVCVNHHRD